MPERSDNRQHTALLTPKEVELLEREAERRGTSISSVLDKAVVDMLDDIDLEAEGLRVPSARGERPTGRGYQFAPSTIARMDAVKAFHDFSLRSQMRAAVFWLERRLKAGGRG